MTLGALFVSALAIGFSGAITPGPLLVACITRTAAGGFRAGLLATVGHAILEFLTVVALSLGLGSLLTRPGVSPAVSVVGGLTLVWMGFATVRGAARGELRLADLEANGSQPAARTRLSKAGGPILTGLAATVSGPYWIIWWATVGLSYVTLAAPLGLTGVAAFYLGHISADFIWYSAVGAAVAGGRRLLTGRGYKSLLLSCGVLLLVLGLVFAGMGISTLARA